MSVHRDAARHLGTTKLFDIVSHAKPRPRGEAQRTKPEGNPGSAGRACPEESNDMATTCCTKPEGVTFGPDEDEAAVKVATAESILFQWACGLRNARQVRTELRRLGVHLMDRLNPNGTNRIDANVDGYGAITLTF